MNLDPQVYNPRMIKNKISSAKNELIDSKAYTRFANSDYEQIILEIFKNTKLKLKTIMYILTSCSSYH